MKVAVAPAPLGTSLRDDGAVPAQEERAHGPHLAGVPAWPAGDAVILPDDRRRAGLRSSRGPARR